jgi:hypothetical protein
MPAIAMRTDKQGIDEPGVALSHDVDARGLVGASHQVEARATISPAHDVEAQAAISAAHDVNASTVRATHDRDQTLRLALLGPGRGIGADEQLISHIESP